MERGMKRLIKAKNSPVAGGINVDDIQGSRKYAQKGADAKQGVCDRPL